MRLHFPSPIAPVQAPARRNRHLHLVRQERVLSLFDPERPVASGRALARARKVAERMSAHLEVLFVCPLFAVRRDSGRRALAILERLASRSARRSDMTVVFTAGLAQEQLARRLRSSRPGIVVVGERKGAGGVWASLAAEASIPVLIARRSRNNERVVAATDATDPAFPTLTRALALARSSADVTLLHNFALRRRNWPVRNITLGPEALQRLRELRAERLWKVAGARSPLSQVVMTTNARACNAVVEHGQRSDADLVVLGAHPQGRGQRRPTSQRIAAKLIERLNRSVLVVPLEVQGGAR